MLTLTDSYEDVVTFMGQDYRIDMTFNNVIDVQTLLIGDEDEFFKVLMTVTLLIDIPFEELIEIDFEHIYEVFDRLIQHLGFKESNESETDSSDDAAPSKKTFDYKQDAEAIYASFFYAYRLDLRKLRNEMHYFEFKALLMNLPEDAPFSKIVGYRTMKIPREQEAGKDYVKHVRQMKRIYRLKGEDNLQDPSKLDYSKWGGGHS